MLIDVLPECSSTFLRVLHCCIHHDNSYTCFLNFCLIINTKKILNVNTKCNDNYQSILLILFTLHNSKLFWSLHLLKSSGLLCNKLLPSRNLMIKSFSLNYGYCTSIPQTPNTFAKFGTLHIPFMSKISCVIALYLLK